MNFKKILRTAVFAAAVALATVSCKKDEETAVAYLSGSLVFKAPGYVKTGSEVTFTASGVTHPENKPLGLYYKVTPGMEKSDTLDVPFDPENGLSWTYTIGDEPQTYTVACYVFATGYSASSSSQTMVSVSSRTDGTGSITGTDFNSGAYSSFTDERDGKSYFTVTAGGREWFAQNLAYEEAVSDGENDLGCGVPYVNSEAMADIFGIYYTQEQARHACPDGWELPDGEAWLALAVEAAGNEGVSSDGFAVAGTFTGIAGALMTDAAFNTITMWEYWPQVKITNSTGFSALSTGFATVSGDTVPAFEAATQKAVFWTADTEGDTGLYHYITVDNPDIYSGYGYESMAASLRCVKSAN